MNMSTSEPEFTITRTLNTRRELVWRAWTEEKELADWLPSTPLETISYYVFLLLIIILVKLTGARVKDGNRCCDFLSTVPL